MDKNTKTIPTRTVPDRSRLTEDDVAEMTEAVAASIRSTVLFASKEHADRVLTRYYNQGVFHQAAFTVIGCNSFSVRPSEIEIINGIVDLQMMLSTIAPDQ